MLKEVARTSIGMMAARQSKLPGIWQKGKGLLGKGQKDARQPTVLDAAAEEGVLLQAEDAPAQHEE